jgi:membrane-associated PAP2 superfamily phosphatase
MMYAMGSKKVPGMMVLHSKGMAYGNTYLIVFKVGPSLTYALAPSILSLLEAPAEGFLWNLPEFGRPIRFDVLLEARFQSIEHPKVTPS